MAATVTELGARVLRRLGVVAVAAADRPSITATSTIADIAARALQSLGVIVPEGERPTNTATVTVTELAARALQALDIPVPASAWPSSPTVVGIPAIALEALVRLGVVASDETPLTADTVLAETAANAVHETLVKRGLVSWAVAAIPTGLRHDYALLTALHLATSFGRQGDASQRPIIEARIGWTALVQRAQALAEARVASIQAGLIGAGLASTDASGIFSSVAEPMVQLLIIDIAPVFGKQADANRIPQFEAMIRRDAVTRRAQAIAEAKVAAVHEGLVAAGLASWDSSHIPRSISEEMVALVANEVAPVLGGKTDPGMVAAYEQRVRRLSLIIAGPALAEQAVRDVHDNLVARGKARWSWADRPSAADRPYVFLAAYNLAPEFGVAQNANDLTMATVDLNRLIALPTSGERVRVEFF